MSELRIGIDIGKRHDPSAIVVALAEPRTIDKRSETHYIVPALKRLELDTPYPDQVRMLADICHAAVKKFNESGQRGGFVKPPKIMIDVTGVGDAVVDLLRPLVNGLGSLHPCRFMSGDRLTQEGMEFKMGKGFFVSRLQVLSESQRIHLPDQLPEAKQLAKEMLDFDIEVDDLTGKATYGAIRPGTHDDLVCAIGLACLQDAEAALGPLSFTGATKTPTFGSGWWGGGRVAEAARHHGGGGASLGGVHHR